AMNRAPLRDGAACQEGLDIRTSVRYDRDMSPMAPTGLSPAESGEYPAKPGEGSLRATRVVPAALRKALMLRARHCQLPGCGRPARWADAHHLEHWIEGGKTRLSNLALVCDRCHRALHEGGWRLARDAGGVMSVPARPP